MFFEFFNPLNAFIFVSTCLSRVSDRKNPKKNLIYSGEEVQKGFREKIHKKISSVSILNGFIFFCQERKGWHVIHKKKNVTLIRQRDCFNFSLVGKKINWIARKKIFVLKLCVCPFHTWHVLFYFPGKILKVKSERKFSFLSTQITLDGKI